MDIKIIVDNKNLRIERLELSTYEANAYIVVCPQTGKSVLIDVPPGARTMVKHLKGTRLQYMLLTHSHIDHIAGLRATRDRVKAPLAVHQADNQKWLPFPPEILLDDGCVIQAGKVRIEAIHTPGHTPGSMCFKIGEYLIAGDTLFPGGPGRTISASAFQQIVKSITEKLFVLPDSTQVFPGHGPSTILKKERKEFAVFSSRQHDPKLHGDVVWLTS